MGFQHIGNLHNEILSSAVFHQIMPPVGGGL